MAVRNWSLEPTSEPPPAAQAPPEELTGQEDVWQSEPEVETAATLTLDPNVALFVAWHGRLVAAVELISPRNKDRPAARAAYLARYLGYLYAGAHLLLIDVHRRPVNFSFPDALVQELQIPQPPMPAPLAAAFRMGEPVPPGGRLVAVWRRALTVGTPLAVMPLPLSVHHAIAVDLELTYQQAAADAYVS